MAPKKGKASKKDDFEDSDVEDSKNMKQSKKKGQSKKGEELLQQSDEDSHSSKLVKKDKKKGKSKAKGDSDDEISEVKSSTKSEGQTSSKTAVKSGPKKKGKGKGKAQDWDSDNEPEVNILVSKSSDSEDYSATQLLAKPKKKSKTKKKVEESDDSGAESLGVDSDLDDLSSAVANVEIEDERKETGASSKNVLKSKLSEKELTPPNDQGPKNSNSISEEPIENSKDEIKVETEKPSENGELITDNQKKMTHKEKKKLKKEMEYKKQVEFLTKKGGQGHSELGDNFTVSQTQKTAGQLQALENAVDIKVENFSISAKGNDLFVNATLLIAHGRRYGLVGPNGHGKTTLLRHIQNRAFAIPPNIDILYCEQEVVADDYTAVESVLRADVKRTKLLEECKNLEGEQEKGNTSEEVQERLKEVLVVKR